LIKGIGFDATCSLVVLDQNEDPLTISPTNDNNQNIILWMDHRALKQVIYLFFVSFYYFFVSSD